MRSSLAAVVRVVGTDQRMRKAVVAAAANIFSRRMSMSQAVQ
jgi:hypothetical protein